MATILILLILNMGTIQGVYLGEYDSPKACERAAEVAAMQLQAVPEVTQAEAAGLICVPKREA